MHLGFYLLERASPFLSFLYGYLHLDPCDFLHFDENIRWLESGLYKGQSRQEQRIFQRKES